jgi:hypothetical protein
MTNYLAERRRTKEPTVPDPYYPLPAEELS